MVVHCFVLFLQFILFYGFQKFRLENKHNKKKIINITTFLTIIAKKKQQQKNNNLY